MRVLTELARRNKASAEEEARRRKYLPAIAQNLRALMGWDELRALRVADALYQRNRGWELRPGAQPIEAQRILAGAAFASLIRWKIANKIDLAPDENAMARALQLYDRAFPWPHRPRKARIMSGVINQSAEMEEGSSTAG